MLLALLIALLAGLSTTIGGYLATHPRMIDRGVLAISLAFAAGAMVFVSFLQIIPVGIDSLQPSIGDASVAAVFAMFFVGMAIVSLIDRVLPHGFNPSHVEGREDKLSEEDKKDNRRLMRSGLMVAVVLALHNFPEGMSTFIASYQELSAGITLAVAIAIHNIPEGVAVAAPVFAATKNRKKAVLWATVSGLAEPLGALVAAVLVSYFIPRELFGLLFGLVAGMMVFLSLDELLPAAQRYASNTHHVLYGVSGGMAVVALSIVLV